MYTTIVFEWHPWALTTLADATDQVAHAKLDIQVAMHISNILTIVCPPLDANFLAPFFFSAFFLTPTIFFFPPLEVAILCNFLQGLTLILMLISSQGWCVGLCVLCCCAGLMTDLRFGGSFRRSADVGPRSPWRSEYVIGLAGGIRTCLIPVTMIWQCKANKEIITPNKEVFIVNKEVIALNKEMRETRYHDYKWHGNIKQIWKSNKEIPNYGALPDWRCPRLPQRDETTQRHCKAGIFKYYTPES